VSNIVAEPASAELASTDPLAQIYGARAAPDAPPPALLPYQQRWVADTAQLKVAEKGRRVGLTWAEASDDVLIASAAGGSNVFYISATQDMAREYIEACAMWARVFNFTATQVGESIFEDGDDAQGNRRFIKTYEISFPGSGHRIVALSSRPTNLRGKQGVVVIDEAAFANDLAGLLKAAMAMLMWGDKVRIISTHDGVENAFNALIQDIRAGKRGKATVHRITFGDAVAEGLFERVCLRKGLTWTQAMQDDWVRAARAFYGDDAAEELDVVPSRSSGAYLSLALIEQRMLPLSASGPWIVRGAWDDAFAYLPADVRRHAIRGWCEEQLLPLLQQLAPDLRHALGQDFARNRDQSVITVLAEGRDLVRRARLTVELQNCPHTSQQQIAEFIIDALPRFRGAAVDATGNGSALAEALAQRYGTQMIDQVKLSDGWYLLHMPKLKGAFQDGTIEIARDDWHRDDLRAIKVIDGTPKIPKQAQLYGAAKAAAADGGLKHRRHGDFAIALLLANYALYREVGEIAWQAAPDRSDGYADDDEFSDLDGEIMVKGGW
jgi:phage FluMu gp28-like protein